MRIVPMLVIVLGMTTGLLAQEKEVGAKNVPASVKSTFEKAYPTATVKKWEQETRDGKPVYEAETLDGTVRRNVVYSPAGELVEVSESLAVDALPSAVVEAIKRQYSQSAIRSVDKITRREKSVFEVTLRGTGPKRVTVTSDGIVLTIK